MAETEPPIPSDASVTFTVKDLVGRIDGKLDLLILKVDEKASRDNVDRLAAVVPAKADAQALDELTKRVGNLEADATTSRAVSTTTRWLLFTAIPAVAGATAVVAALIK